MKPKLETQRDVDHKNAAKHKVESAWDCKIVDLYEPLYRLDWWIPEKNVYIEHKQRAVSTAKYPDIILSLSKVMMMSDFISVLGARCFFVVGFTDGLMYTEIKETNDYPVTASGRTDRGIEGDVEPCIRIPMSSFNDIC